MQPKWICPREAVPQFCATEFYKIFKLTQIPVTAVCTATALGVYDLTVNGRPVCSKNGHKDELKPGYTECGVRVLTHTYDIAPLLNKGENVLSAVVTDGWWRGKIVKEYGKTCAFYAQVVMAFEDGSQQTVCTGPDWFAGQSRQVISADIYEGEKVDGGQQPLFAVRGGSPAEEYHDYHGEISPMVGPSPQIRPELERPVCRLTLFENGKPVSCVEKFPFTLLPGQEAVVDFGQNAAGWVFVSASAAAKTVLRVRHGEMLNDTGDPNRGDDGPKGTLYTANLRGISASAEYRFAGTGEETYHPGYTFFGFRYAELTADAPVTFSRIAAQTLTSIEQDNGVIETSDRRVNQLISNIRWGQYSNYLSVPTDCPQRNERLGWTADTQVFAGTGMYFADCRGFFKKWFADLRDSQNRENGAYTATAPHGVFTDPNTDGAFGWADAGILVPYYYYRMYGDSAVLAQHYNSMKKFMDGFMAQSDGRGGTGLYGDWLAYEGNDDEIKAIGAAAYYAYDANLLSRIAKILGHFEDAERYYRLFLQEKAYFQEQFVAPDGSMKRDAQTPCLMALRYDLLDDPAPVLAQLLANLKRSGNRLQTGFLGTAILLPTLSQFGADEMAYRLLLQDQDPSWLYSVDQGATTIWERWNSYTVEKGFGEIGMNSFNHYAYGSVGEWMFRTMAGIDFSYDDAGQPVVSLAPHPDPSVQSVRAGFRGIESEWQFSPEGWKWNITVPSDVSATIQIPKKDARPMAVTSGTYSFFLPKTAE